MKNKFYFMVGFMFLLGIFYTGILVVVDYLTAPIIEQNEKAALQRNVLTALGIEFEEKNLAEVFSSLVEIVEKDGLRFFISQKGETAFQFEGPGLWGPIEGIIALENDMERVRNLTIIRQRETPGLGGRIEEPEFLSQFSGKKFKPSLVITAPGMAVEDYEVDGITAATMTVKALEQMINLQLAKHIEALK